MNIAEIMTQAQEAVKPWSKRLGSAVVEDIGQDAVMACWEAAEAGEPFDVDGMVNKLANREYWHARSDQGTVTVPLDDMPEWMPSINISAGSEPGMDFGVSRMPVPGVAPVTAMEMLQQAAVSVGAHVAVLDWLEDANAAKKRGRPVAVPAPLVEAVGEALPAVLAFWAHRNRTRCVADWGAAHAMSPTTEPVRSPAEISNAEVTHFAREGKPRLKPTPVKVAYRDDESDMMAMLSFGPGKVNAPSRRGKREGQATVALGGRARWADVGGRH